MAQHKHYFAQDGNFGSATNLVVVVTENFTTKDWQNIDEASDSDRARVALAISKRRNK